jgi:hypothetical protein
LAHHVNIAGEAICPELDEKRKCFAEHVKEAATAATSSGSLAMLAAMRQLAFFKSVVFPDLLDDQVHVRAL